MLGLLTRPNGQREEHRVRVESPIELTAETLWTEISARLQGTLNETTYSTWFGEVEGADLADDAFVLGVPNDFTREWIEGHFLGLISAALEDATGRELRIALKVVEAAGERPVGPSPLPAEIETVPAAVPAQVAPRPATTGMNPKYTFDSFVIGSSNRFAHAAALAVAEAPAQAYNPLFIYGGTGLGKTHLLQAIANYVATHTGGISVRYVTS
jgi:chromosomal replication initiator protein